MNETRGAQTRFRFALTGVLVGALFPIFAGVLVFVFNVGSTILLAIIALAVPILGTVGTLIGAREERLRALAEDLEETIEERTSAIRSMLDVTGDGFLTFGPDYRVAPEYSKPCEEIFGGPIAGKRLPDLLYIDERPRQEFVDGLDLFFTGKAKAEVIFDLLDHRIEVRDRIIEISYRAIDETTVMCALTDVTEQERLEAAVEEQNRRRDLILRVVSSKQYFATFVDEANELFQVLEAISSHRTNTIPSETAERLAAQVHTFKGNASFLGFTRTATVAHDFEDQLAALPILQSDLDLSSEIFVLKRQYYEEYNAIAETLGERWINDLTTINVPATMIEKVENYVRRKYAGDQALVRAMEQLRSVPLVDLFSRYPQLIRDIAGRRGRRVRDVELTGGEFRVLPERFEGLASTMTHIARNMIEHGIESPAERELKGKDPRGEVRIDITRNDGEVTISLSDDGQGISFPAVEARARERGLIDGEGTPSRTELLGLLFSAGFSTTDEVTTTSGRGVGLNAVQQSVKRLGGRIAVETKPGRGTTFRITVPEQPRRSEERGAQS
ncbi:MAG: ATP-binding protein [Spirochaetota bacterium]